MLLQVFSAVNLCQSAFNLFHIISNCNKYTQGLFVILDTIITGISYLLMVRSFANPSSLSTQRSDSSFFLDLEEVLGAMFLASDTVTTFWKRSRGLPSAEHNNLALFSYITCCNHKRTKHHCNFTLFTAGNRKLQFLVYNFDS